MLSLQRNVALGALALTIALAVLGAFVPEWILYTCALVLAKGLVVLGLCLLLRMNLVSFGQGLYYCAGAYICGLVSQMGISDAFFLTFLAALGSAVVGLILGLFLSGYRSVFFAMFNLALSMILYGVLLKSISLGGSDGVGVAAPTYLGYAPDGEMRLYVFFVFALAVAGASSVFAFLYTKSEMGLASASVKDCEIRLEYLGLSVRYLIIFNFVIASTLAGIGGALVAMVSGHIIPELAYWTTSGEFVFITVLSGPNGILSAFGATAVFETIRLVAGQNMPNSWQMLLGSFLLLSILFMPNGISGLFRRAKAPKPDAVGEGINND
ncbi:branched-chain amino acid ABC transporter permease [Roseovarius sp. ZX-A-9]|uniref:branched-chain amino acid ABC transporter permease n=1 Tax=Roseovarius sp. ZX-A-9 TaxID=3014783 RepID=UPI00232C3D71|nr:branched-chain amino acid ABC transporter permease [Roseovarius sp. ZX-A-9]